MARRDRLGLSAVRTEGAILPPSILARIHREDPTLGGLKPDDYDLSGTKIREAASQAWNALQGPWRAFQAEREKLAPGEAATGMTRRRWLDQILKALDYGTLDPLRESQRVGEREYPISHRFKSVPMHLVGCGLDLDKRTPGAVGASKTSPHGLVQLYLNAEDGSLWGFVSNGLKWRILRDSVSLSRQAMVEFDLETIFEGQLYDEFLLFYLVAHPSRVKADRPEECWLEKWSQAAGEEGKRALTTLRNGVEKAIVALGQGFLRNPSNRILKERLREGSLDKQDYYRQLLRMVYRLLFLFVAEDRGLLLRPDADEATKQLFTDHYGTQRLRLLAERLRGSTRHHDLYLQLQLVLKKLGEENGCPELGLPALGGFLFSEEACTELDSAALANSDLLEAIRCLAVTEEGGRRTRVDYKNLASEEMGSVYESLLELHPELRSDGSEFVLLSASGNERKTSGSYYTPDSLIQCLLDTALEPVVADRLKQAGPDPKAQEAAILALTVIDPAVGSGHFLIAAAHRLSKRLAQVRSGDDEPSPEAVRHALRDVIGKCLYGIDINPMSAELCKVALWMEALEPGKPLNFLDHHIVVGNSLLGTTPELIAAGIPDGAFDAIEGDDKEVCKRLKKQNKQERDAKQGNLFDPHAFAGKDMLAAWQEIESIPDQDLKAIRKKEKTFRQAEAALAMRKLIADTWCAAFTLTKTPPVPGTNAGGIGVTTATIRRLLNGQPMPEAEQNAVQAEAQRFGFLHPHLVFPGVLAKGGFDVVIGNPPWEHSELKEKEWFVGRADYIAAARTSSERKRLISSLQESHPSLLHEFRLAKRAMATVSSYAIFSGRFPLCGRGRINTYAVFAELNRSLLNDLGRAGIIVPSGIATDDTTKFFFADLMEQRTLASLYDFENGMREADDSEDEESEDDEGTTRQRRKPRRDGEERRLFAGVHSSFKFCLLTMTGTAVQPKQPQFAFFLHRVSDLSIPGKAFTLTLEDIALLNPNTKTCPVFRTERDARILNAVHQSGRILHDDIRGNFWQLSTKPGLFNMSQDSKLFIQREKAEQEGFTLESNRLVRGQEELVPLYEAKMATFFDHRAASVEMTDSSLYSVGQTKSLSIQDKADPHQVVLPRFWIEKHLVESALADQWDRDWLFCWRQITNSTNERTAIPCILPRVGVGHSAYVALFCVGQTTFPAPLILCLYANFASFLMDYTVRQKLGGVNLTPFTVKQLPIMSPSEWYEPCIWGGVPRYEWAAARALELTYTAVDLEGLANDLGYDGPPFIWNDERRFWLRAELDAAFFHIYGIERHDVDYIMETFPIVKRKDITSHGSYRTKESILRIYDEMAEAMANGTSYQTHLDPPPANGWVPPTFPEPEDGKVAAPATNLPEVEQGAGVDPGSIGGSERDLAFCAMLLSGIQLQGRMSQVIAHQLLSHASNPDLVVLDLPMEHKLAAELSVDLVPASVRTSPIASGEVSNIVLHLRNLEAITVSSNSQIQPGPKFSENRSYFGVSIDDWMRLAVQSFNANAQQTDVDASLTQHE